MLATYAIGITMKFTLAGLVNNQVLEATVGLLLPVAIMAALQLRGHIKGYVCPGYTKIEAMEDTAADVEPDAATRRAVKSYSFMAINCFLVTIGAIALLLVYLMCTEAYDPVVCNIMTATCLIIAALIGIYVAYRVVDSRKKPVTA